MRQHNQSTKILAERTAFEFSRCTVQYVCYRNCVAAHNFQTGIQIREIKRDKVRPNVVPKTQEGHCELRTANFHWNRQEPDDDDDDDDNPYMHILENYLDFILYKLCILYPIF
jgi:hypothetical protein